MNTIKYVLVILLFPFLIACSDWLDVKPKTETEASELFKNEEGFKTALAGCYTLMNQPSLYGRELSFGLVEVMAHQWIINEQNKYSDIEKGLYQTVNASQIINPIWSGLYNVIANANSILQYIDEKKSVFTDNNYSIIKGEALAIKSYAHLDLLRLFGKNGYSTSAKDGIPYVATISKNIPISISPQDFMDKVMSDLDLAQSLLEVDPICSKQSASSDNEYLQNRNFHLNYYAIWALKARAYLYAGNKSEALRYAKKVIDVQNEGLFPWITPSLILTEEKNLRDRTFSTEHIFALNNRKIQDNITGYFYATDAPYQMQGSITDVYPISTDLRSKLFEISSTIDNVPSKLWQMDAVYVNGVKKEPKKYRMSMLRISEMYYIAAMCSETKQNALNFLHEVQLHRGYSSDDISNDEDLLSELRNELRREWVCEGQLFYFLKINPELSEADKYYNFVLPRPDSEIEFGL